MSPTDPSTVWLASYPKSGNTWARAVLGCLTPPPAAPLPAALDDAADDTPLINALDGGPVASSRWFLDAVLGLSTTSLRPDEIDALRPACDAALDAQLGEVRVRKVHDAFRRRPGSEPIVAPAATRAVVYVVRDPRDVAVSYAHHRGRPVAWAVDELADPDAALAAGTTPHSQVRQHLGTWSGHVRSWLEQTHAPVAVFRYEDLHADPVGEFTRMAAAADLAVTPEEVAAAVEAARFDRLQAQERAAGFRERPRRSAPFFRRGEAGSWREELPASLARRIEDDHGEVMRALGYLGN